MTQQDSRGRRKTLRHDPMEDADAILRKARVLTFALVAALAIALLYFGFDGLAEHFGWHALTAMR